MDLVLGPNGLRLAAVEELLDRFLDDPAETGNDYLDYISKVWSFEVSGMPVVRKWLGYRMTTPAGRAASSSSPLDQIRPENWNAQWTEELLDLISVLQHTVDSLPSGSDLLQRICEAPVVAASEFPPPPAELREPPLVRRAHSGHAMNL